MAPASSRTHPLEDRSLAAIGSTKGGSGVARADRGLAPSLFLSAPLLVPPDSAVEKALSPPPALERVVASVHRPSIVKPEPRRPQGPGTAPARPRLTGNHRMVSSGVTKPAKSSSRRPPPTGARRPTREEFLGARKHASTETGPRAAPVHRGSPGQGRTLLRGPKAVSNPLDEPITRPAPSRKRKGACKGDEPETASNRRVERSGALRPLVKQCSNSARPSPQGVGRQFSTGSIIRLAQASGAKRDPSRPRRVPRQAPASFCDRPLDASSVDPTDCSLGTAEGARDDRELASCLFQSLPPIV